MTAARLVAAAVELFYRHGFAAVGVDRVVEFAGVTKTTFYKHFESKDDLLLTAFRERVRIVGLTLHTGKTGRGEGGSERKQDLLILITPHIIDEGESVDSPAGDR